jgi:hypothetical protein
MEHKHMTDHHRLIIERVFDKYTKLLEEACTVECHSAVDRFMDIVKDADHILRKHNEK